MTTNFALTTPSLNRTPPLRCPKDHTPLLREGNDYACTACNARYPMTDGVVRFLTETDAFYEGAYTNQIFYVPRSTSVWSELPLWIITNGYLWGVRKYVPRGGRVAELGCAAGVAWFGKAYSMIGVDVSHAGLAIAAKKYDACLQAANLAALPDASLDAVVSSYFWEHIPPDVKEVMTQEFKRVLKPGGYIVFVYDVETKNPLISWLRRLRPDLYQSLFIDGDGHLGYEPLAVNDRRFVRHGFTLVRSNAMERTPLQSPSVYKKMVHWQGAPRMLGKLCFLGNAPFVKPYWAFLRVIDETVGRLFPRSWGRIAITIARKDTL